MLWRRLVAVLVMVALIVPIATGGRAQQGDDATPPAVGSPAAVPTEAPVTALPSTGTGDPGSAPSWAMWITLTGIILICVTLVGMRRWTATRAR